MKNIRNFLNIIKSELQLPIFFGLSLTLLTGLIAGSYVTFAQNELPLFYSLSSSDQVLQPKIWLLLIPSLSMLISVITISMTFAFSSLETSLLKLYTWASLASQIVLFMATLRIIYITY